MYIGIDTMAGRSSLAHFLKTKFQNGSHLFSTTTEPCSCKRNEEVHSTLFSMDRARMREVLDTLSHDMTYVYPIDTVFTTMAKAGSSTTWRMIFMGLTGKTWRNIPCGIPQNKSSQCWRPYLSRVKHMSEDEQWRVLTDNKTLRVAIQRDPFSRLISAFKNKIACDAERYNTTLSGDRMHVLRMQAMMPPGPNCMNISEYADALDRIRENVGKPGYLSSMRWIDEHFRPFNFYAQEIFYHLILDVSDLSNFSRISPFLDRLPYAQAVQKSNFHCLDSGSAPLMMDDMTARKLNTFAALSSTAPVRYLN